MCVIISYSDERYTHITQNSYTLLSLFCFWIDDADGGTDAEFYLCDFTSTAVAAATVAPANQQRSNNLCFFFSRFPFIDSRTHTRARRSMSFCNSCQQPTANYMYVHLDKLWRWRRRAADNGKRHVDVRKIKTHKCISGNVAQCETLSLPIETRNGNGNEHTNAIKGAFPHFIIFDGFWFLGRRAVCVHVWEAIATTTCSHVWLLLR